ncbi:MAG: hypothetical protein AB1600_12445 [Bacteroidota bacterium]
MKYSIFTVCLIFIIGCEPERSIVPNTHDNRVPEIINVTAWVDSISPTRKVVRIRWAKDTLKQYTDQLKNWEVFRSLNDTAQFTSRGTTFIPAWDDASVHRTDRDVTVFYKIFPNGELTTKGQFIGKPSDVIKLTVRK